MQGQGIHLALMEANDNSLSSTVGQVTVISGIVSGATTLQSRRRRQPMCLVA